MTGEVVIEANKSRLPAINLVELWEFRELLWVFAWRDLKVRYKQTVLGIFWVIFQPVVITTIFSVFFGRLVKLPSEGIPYPLFTYIGYIVWTLFSSELLTVTTSVVAMGGIVQKVYFPRILIPLSAMVTPLVDFGVSLLPLVIMELYYGLWPSWLLLPFMVVFLLIILALSGGLGMVLAALQVRYRDIRYLLSFLIQIGLFVTPVIYPLSVIHDYRRTILALNPLSGVIENARLLLAGRTNLDLPLLLLALLVAAVSFVCGVIFFEKKQGTFADVL